MSKATIKKRLTYRGFDFNADFVTSNLQAWPIARALQKLQRLEDMIEDGIITVPEEQED